MLLRISRFNDSKLALAPVLASSSENPGGGLFRALILRLPTSFIKRLRDDDEFEKAGETKPGGGPRVTGDGPGSDVWLASALPAAL